MWGTLNESKRYVYMQLYNPKDNFTNLWTRVAAGLPKCSGKKSSRLGENQEILF